MKGQILLKRFNLAFSLSSILYGFLLLSFPQILQTYHVYNYIGNIFSYRTISLTFILLGVLHLIGVITKDTFLRKVSNFCLTFVWLMFAVSCILAVSLGDIPNTIIVLALLEAFLGWAINIGESR